MRWYYKNRVIHVDPELNLNVPFGLENNTLDSFSSHTPINAFIICARKSSEDFKSGHLYKHPSGSYPYSISLSLYIYILWIYEYVHNELLVGVSKKTEKKMTE